jgi:hypothetical protein
MKEVSSSNFGILVAFILPGFMVLWGVSYFSETVRVWLSASDNSVPTVGGFMYVTLASVAAGMIASTVRWATIDRIHRWTGLRQPDWDFSRLQENVAAYTVLNEIHYKYYQCHSNAEVALVFVYLARRIHLGFFTAPVGWLDLGFLLLSIILFAGSRDTLKKYYSRVSHVLGTELTEQPVAQAICDRLTAPPRSIDQRTRPRLQSPHNPAVQSPSKN